MSDKKLFQYFLTIFYVHYTSLMDIYKMGPHLKRRSTLIILKLRSILQILNSEINDIDLKARESAKLYKKSIIVRTKADPQLPKGISLVIKSTNNRLLQIGANSRSLFEVKHRYDKENDLRLVIEVCHNSRVIEKANVVEGEISGKIGLKKTIECGSNQIHVYFEWILDEDSCQKHLDNPLLISKYFSTVLLALGFDYWAYFRTPFQVLAKHTDIQVRQLIYHSLHEMAFILDKTEKTYQLVPLFRLYLKEVSEFDANYFQNCIVFFADINHSERLQVLSSFRLLLEDDSDLSQKLKTVMANKLIAFIDDFDMKHTRDQLIEFFIDLLVTSDNQNDSKHLLRQFSICVNKLFPKDMSLNEDTIEELVDNQILIMNNIIKRIAIRGSVELMDIICRQLVSDGILSDINYNKIEEQIAE